MVSFRKLEKYQYFLIEICAFSGGAMIDSEQISDVYADQNLQWS